VQRKARVTTHVAIVVIAAGLLAACSSGGGSKGSSSDTTKVESITVAGNAPTFTAAIYVAEENGYFAAQHVKVTVLDNQGPNVPTLVVSGKADIGIGAAAAEPILLSAKGQHVSEIYGEGGGGLSGALVVSPGTTLDQLKSKQGCKIGTYPQGTSAYGYAVIYQKSLPLTNCTFSIFQSAPLQIAALTGGSVDAIIGSPSNFSATVDAGKAEFLINPSKAADRSKYAPNPPAWESADFGIVSNLTKKRTAVQSFFAGYQQGKDWIRKNGPAAAAAIVVKYPAAKAYTVAQLTSTLTTNAPFNDIPTATGQITEESWNTSLKFFSSFGLPDYDASNPDYTYSKLVDMSFLKSS
jgi:ABC-type nitrate/sulfonate/bicarbonate transport system substrate-binding protein